jgi:hypothetical protein
LASGSADASIRVWVLEREGSGGLLPPSHAPATDSPSTAELRSAADDSDLEALVRYASLASLACPLSCALPSSSSRASLPWSTRALLQAVFLCLTALARMRRADTDAARRRPKEALNQTVKRHVFALASCQVSVPPSLVTCSSLLHPLPALVFPRAKPGPTDPVGQSWPRGTGSVGDSVGEGRSLK